MKTKKSKSVYVTVRPANGKGSKTFPVYDADVSQVVAKIKRALEAK